MGLQELDGDFEKQAVPDRPDFQQLPEGQYQVRVFALDVVNTKKQPVRPMLKLEFEVIAGKMAKRRVWKNCMLTADNLQYLKADLSNLGWKFKLSDIELADKRGTLLDRVVNLRVKYKGKDDQGRDRQQVYINSSQAATTSVPPAEAAKRASAVSAGAEDDEPPF